MRCQGQIEGQARAIKIRLQLIPGAAKQGGFLLIPPTTPIKRDNGAILFRDGEVAKIRQERKLRHDAGAKWHYGCAASSGGVLDEAGEGKASG